MDLTWYLSRKAFNDEQTQQLVTLYQPFFDNGYTINCTGDVCKGDEIVFSEAIFSGSWKNAKFSHFEVIKGVVVNDSYGTDKQQHTFTIQLSDGTKIKRKGRNIYKYLTLRKERDEKERSLALEEKHERGDKARTKRFLRKNTDGVFL